MQALREKIKTVEQFIKDYPVDTEEERPLPPLSKPTIESFEQRLQFQLYQINEQMKDLKKAMEIETGKFKVQKDLHEKREAERKRLAQIDDVAASLKSPLDQINLLKDNQAYEADTIAPPAFAGKVEPKPLVVFPLALLGGLVVGAGLAWAAEMSDRSFRSPHEIRRPPGAVDPGPHTAVRAGRSACRRSARTRPRPVHRPQYQGDRIGGLPRRAHCALLQHARRTAPDHPGHQPDAWATARARCAPTWPSRSRSRASACCLIDADCRRPRQHRLFDVTNVRGLVTVITDQATCQRGHPADAGGEPVGAGVRPAAEQSRRAAHLAALPAS